MMQKNKQYKGAVFFDLDGTLLDNRKDEVPESALEGLRRLKEKGYLVCLATGRDMNTGYSAKYLDMVKPDAVIHLNGNKITAGTEVLLEHHMDRELFRKLIRYSEEKHFCVGTSIGSRDFYTEPELKIRNDRAWNKHMMRNFRPMEELLAENTPVLAVNFAGDNILEIKKEVELDFPALKLFPFNSNTGADVVEEGFSKAQGMKRICEHYGIDMKNTWAFGDSPNDLPMFETAFVSIAMGNGDETVKSRADLVTDAVDREGIRNALLRLELI